MRFIPWQYPTAGLRLVGDRFVSEKREVTNYKHIPAISQQYSAQFPNSCTVFLVYVFRRSLLLDQSSSSLQVQIASVHVQLLEVRYQILRLVSRYFASNFLAEISRPSEARRNDCVRSHTRSAVQEPQEIDNMPKNWKKY